MFRLFFTSVAACILCITPAFAEKDDADVLASYLEEAEVSGMGTCDGMRSTIVRLEGPDDETDYRVEMFSPVTNSSLRFYVVVKESGSEYFIKRFKGDDPPEVDMLEPIDWGMELVSHSMNYYYAHFFPDRDHDCVVRSVE